MKNKTVAVVLAAAMVLGLTACGSSATESKEGSSAAGEVSVEAGSSAASGTAVGSTDYNGVTLSMMDWGDSIKTQRTAFNKSFMASHAGLTINYTTLAQDQFNSDIASLQGSGDAPDIFYVPSSMTLAQLVSEGWVMPIDDYLDKDFLSKLDAAAYSQGIGSIDGKTYGVNIVAPTDSMLVYYNKDVLDAAGVKEIPTTYSEFLDACKKVTDSSGGKAYGYVDGLSQTMRLDTLARGLTGMAGGLTSSASTNIVMQKDNALCNSDQMLAAEDFLSDLYSAGAIHPDSGSLNAPQAREYFANGKAAFICQGVWCISTWAADYPDLNYGVMALPVPDGYTGGSSLFKTNGGNVMVISSTCKHPELAAEYIESMLQDETFLQSAVSSGALLSTVTGANDKYITDEHVKQFMELDSKYAHFIPQPTCYSNEANKLVTQVQAVSPDLGAITQGVMTGGIAKGDIKRYLDTYSDALLKEWHRAADAAGVTMDCITCDDWKFGEDYVK